MYLHILLLLFLICLFVLSLEQAQADFQHHVNTSFTNHEIHPGESKSIHSETDQATRVVNFEQNFLESNSRNRDQRFVFVLENDESIPSCSFSKAFDVYDRNGEITDSSNFFFNESQHSSIQTEDKEKLKLVPVCADILKLRELVNRSYENYNAVNVCDNHSQTTANRYSPVRNDTNLNSFTDEFVLNENLMVFTNYTNNIGSNNDSFSIDFGDHKLNDDNDIKFDQTLTSNCNQSNKITDNQEGFLNDTDFGRESLMLAKKAGNETQQVRPSYYISENEHNFIKSCGPYDSKSKYNKINYKLLMMPMLLPEKMLRNLTLFTNLDLINTTEQFDFLNIVTKKASGGIKAISSINEYPKPLPTDTINLDGLTNKQSSMIENTRKSSSDCFKTLTSVAHKPTKKTDLKSGTAQSVFEFSTDRNRDNTNKNVSAIKSLTDTSVSSSTDLITNELHEQIFMNVLQNFLGLLDASNDSSPTSNGGEQNTKSTHFNSGPGGIQ